MTRLHKSSTGLICTALLVSIMLANAVAEEPIDQEGAPAATDARGTNDNSGSLPESLFVNPIGEGADPWVTRDPNSKRYLWCMSEGNRAIAIHTSGSVTSMGKKHIVWQAPSTGMFSRQVWAPELHYLDDRWHIYFAASDGKNKNHLTYVLRSRTTDPLGDYELSEAMATGDGRDGQTPNVWAIDMTVLQHQGKRYALWSGWDAQGIDQQYLYIAPMESPVKLAGPRVRLCDNDDYLWERLERDLAKRGLNEGPQVYQANGQTSVVFSCGASWLTTYKLGLLELVGDDLLDPASWQKRPTPVFDGSETVYGVGHSCFVQSLDNQSWWHVYHSKRDRRPGWRRSIHVQPMRVGKRGFPVFGEPFEPGIPMNRPADDTTGKVSGSTASFRYFGHHQFMTHEGEVIHLGRVPNEPINDYRCGEKVVFDQRAPNDMEAEVMIDFLGNNESRDAGVLFRCTGASVGYDAQRGYFAGLIPKTGLVILGKTDGNQWTELARTPTTIDPEKPQRLRVRMVGDRIVVSHNDTEKLRVRDKTYATGAVGLRVVNTHAVFKDLVVQASD
ncbi:MAG: family 43 glycosylhydrolase [Fuerstiella sp.]